MTNRLIPRFLAGAAVLAVAVTGLSGPALAAPGKGTLESVTETSSESGRQGGDSVRPGFVSRGIIGVRNTGTAPIAGLVVQIQLNDDHLQFARQYENCWYARDGKPDSAWCEFDDELIAKSVLSLMGPVFSVKADTPAGTRVKDVRFGWASAEWAEANGGIQALADKDATEGTTAVRGDEGTLAVEPGSPRLRSGPTSEFAFVSTAVVPGGTPPTGLPRIPPSEPDAARLAAVQEKTDNTFQGPVHRTGPNQTVPGTYGVRNLGDATVDGLVVELRLSDIDLKFAKKYDNCWYALEDKPDSAWCEFDTALPADATRQLAGPVTATGAEIHADLLKDVRFHWVSEQWAEAHGGIEALARGDASPGTDAVRGTEGTLTLKDGSASLVGHLRGATDFILALWPPGATEPTPTPTVTTTTPGGGTGGGTGGEGGGGGLPVTGAQTSLVGAIGGGLLLAGLLAFFITRRRTRFTA